MVSRYAGGAAVIMAAVLLLVGCGLIPIGPEPNPEPVLRVQIVPPLTAVLNARENNGTAYHWDLGDGTPVFEGPDLIQHTYAAKGRYAVIVVIEDAGFNGGGGGGPAIGGGAQPGAPGSGLTSAYIVVDLIGDQPQAVIIILNLYARPITGLYAFLPVVFYGEASSDPSGQGLAYWWEIVRWDPTLNQPKPPPPLIDGTPRPIEWIRSTEMNFRLERGLDGPGGCYVPPWTYRVRLVITDSWGRQHEAVRFLTVW